MFRHTFLKLSFVTTLFNLSAMLPEASSHVDIVRVVVGPGFDLAHQDEMDLPFNEAKKKALWGTYGKDGVNHPHLTWVRLIDCSTEHLLSILKTQRHIHYVLNCSYQRIIESILMDRGAWKETHETEKRESVPYPANWNGRSIRPNGQRSS